MEKISRAFIDAATGEVIIDGAGPRTPNFNHHFMPSNSNYEPRTPSPEPKRHEYDTIRKCRFYDAFDSRKKGDSFRQICKHPQINIPPSTARRWLKEREILGSKAFRRTRKISKRLGRDYTVSEATLAPLLDENNPLNTKPYETQIKELHLPLTTRSLRRNFSKRFGARRYKKPYTKEISQKNHIERIQYGQEHRFKTISDFWQWIYFTDEAHFNSKDLSTKAEYSLRRPSSQSRLSRLKETKESGLNITLHVAAGISYNGKGCLVFYNDPEDPGDIRQRKPPKPHKSSVETEAEYRKKVEDWQASLPHPFEVKSSGNSMTQKYYAEHILPAHIKAVKDLELRYPGHQIWLQEDNDRSHGTASTNNPPRRLKIASRVSLLRHPAQSPDLNPIESIWQIIKSRLRGGSWQTIAEFKAAIMREWRRITLAQIRRRIKEMPWRCRRVIELEGARIRSTLW